MFGPRVAAVVHLFGSVLVLVGFLGQLTSMPEAGIILDVGLFCTFVFYFRRMTGLTSEIDDTSYAAAAATTQTFGSFLVFLGVLLTNFYVGVRAYLWLGVLGSLVMSLGGLMHMLHAFGFGQETLLPVHNAELPLPK